MAVVDEFSIPAALVVVAVFAISAVFAVSFIIVAAPVIVLCAVLGATDLYLGRKRRRQREAASLLGSPVENQTSTD